MVAVCSVCTEAVQKQLPLPNDSHSKTAREAFVDTGFSSWARAIKAFQRHENSNFHRAAFAGLGNIKKPTIIACLSDQKRQEMKDARKAIEKVFETVNFLAQEGIAFRAKDDGNSKFMRFLKLRATDVPELNSWIHRSSGFKWLHHSIIEEILKLLADAVVQKICFDIRQAGYFALMIDETSDIARLEQISFSFRFVESDLSIREEFLGFYETSNTTSLQLYRIVQDVFTRLQLDSSSLRGQCYDGASSVSGKKRN